MVTNLVILLFVILVVNIVRMSIRIPQAVRFHMTLLHLCLEWDNKNRRKLNETSLDWCYKDVLRIRKMVNSISRIKYSNFLTDEMIAKFGPELINKHFPDEVR